MLLQICMKITTWVFTPMVSPLPKKSHPFVGAWVRSLGPKFIPLFSSTFITFYNFLVFSLSPIVLFLLQICINLYYILFLFPSNLFTIVQLFSNI
jgi:hypothetical protein